MTKYSPDTLEKLARLVEILDRVEQHEFNIDVWDCGTAACAVGWAARDWWFNERGLKLVEVCAYSCVSEPRYGSLRGFPAVAAFLGVDTTDVMDWFWSARYPGVGFVTPAMVADRIRTAMRSQVCTSNA